MLRNYDLKDLQEVLVEEVYTRLGCVDQTYANIWYSNDILGCFYQDFIFPLSNPKLTLKVGVNQQVTRAIIPCSVKSFERSDEEVKYSLTHRGYVTISLILHTALVDGEGDPPIIPEIPFELGEFTLVRINVTTYGTTYQYRMEVEDRPLKLPDLVLFLDYFVSPVSEEVLDDL